MEAFKTRKLTETEIEKAKEILSKLKRADTDYMEGRSGEDKRLQGFKAEVWFNTELEKLFKRRFGSQAGFEWIAETKEVRGYVQQAGDFFITYFGTIEVKSTNTPKECKLNIQRWNNEPTLYVAILLQKEPDVFQLLGFKYGHEIYKSKTEGNITFPNSYYIITKFRSPSLFINKLKKISKLHSKFLT